MSQSKSKTTQQVQKRKRDDGSSSSSTSSSAANATLVALAFATQNKDQISLIDASLSTLAETRQLARDHEATRLINKHQLKIKTSAVLVQKMMEPTGKKIERVKFEAFLKKSELLKGTLMKVDKIITAFTAARLGIITFTLSHNTKSMADVTKCINEILTTDIVTKVKKHFPAVVKEHKISEEEARYYISYDQPRIDESFRKAAVDLKRHSVITRFGWTTTTLRLFIETVSENETRRLYVTDPFALSVLIMAKGGPAKIETEVLLNSVGRNKRMIGTGVPIPKYANLLEISEAIGTANAAETTVKCYESTEDTDSEAWILKMNGGYFTSIEDAKNARDIGNLLKIRRLDRSSNVGNNTNTMEEEDEETF